MYFSKLISECNCGLDVGCSFSWFGKTCEYPAGHSYFNGFCRGEWNNYKIFINMAKYMTNYNKYENIYVYVL